MSPPVVSAGPFTGRYVIEHELGRGASAIVYRARDLERGRVVAIKVLHDELVQSTASDRFLREIRRHSGLQHPRILPVLDAGDHAGQLYCVFPFMEGGTLRQRLARERQLPIADAVAIARTVADALEYAHRHGIIHRDVKPENILFTGGEPCLADFGIARTLEHVMGDTSTSRGVVRGTVAYMSPEQASGERDYDGRSDVFSLGCVLYEMLAGVPAFIGATAEAVLAQRFMHRPRELRVYRPLVSPALEAVVSKALEMSPADRYQTASAFADALVAGIEDDRVATDDELRVSAGRRAPARSRVATPGGDRRDARRRRRGGARDRAQPATALSRARLDPRRRLRRTARRSGARLRRARARDGRAESIALSEHVAAHAAQGDDAPGGHSGQRATRAGARPPAGVPECRARGARREHHARGNATRQLLHRDERRRRRQGGEHPLQRPAPRATRT